MEDDEYKKLPPEEKCMHKLWKARQCGYEEVTKLFQQIDDEKSPEFAKYLSLIKHFVNDANAAAQEKGLEATLAFVENYAYAGKIVNEVISGVIKKGIAANKTKTKELSLQIILMYVEIEKQDVVIEELVKGMDQKNPKLVCGCINACTLALREFGNKIINVKPLVKKIPVLFADRDKGVRDEGRSLVVEIFKWVGPAIKSQLSNLQPVQLTELEAEFAKLDKEKMIPSRYIRSEQAKKAIMSTQNEVVEDDEADEECDGKQEIDPYELADAVEIISKLPKDFYSMIESKKWQERKEMLETLEGMVKAPKLESGDYGDLVRALRRIIQKDSNVVCVTLAGKCICLLATGLKKKFQTYASACVLPILEKFKEKKQNVVAVMRDAIDAVYLTTSIEPVLEDVLEALGNKNPSVKSETALFLSRAFTRTPPTMVNKKILKAACTGLLKLIHESDPVVRDSTCEALGALMKLVGEKAVSPFLVEVEKDSIKMTKIRECCEKTVLAIKVSGPKKERPATAPVKAPGQTAKPSNSVPAKSNKRPATATQQQQATISSGTATIVKSKGKPKSRAQIERELTDEEALEKVVDLITEEMLSALADSNWKIRLESSQNILSTLQEMEAPNVPTQAVVKILNRKPGLKDTNFQVLNVRFDIVRHLAQNSNFTTTSANCCLNDIAEKLGDSKSGIKAGETLTAIAEAVTLNHVSLQVLEFAMSQKSPKVMQETFIWLCTAIKEFGFLNLNVKALIDNTKKALASTNPAVRTAAIKLLGVMYLYMGNTLHVFFDSEKPALKEQIVAEFNKNESIKPPIPIRGMVKSENSNSSNEDNDDPEAGDAPAMNIQDLLPRIDISAHITEALINEISDKNWKVRNEALTKVTTIISEAKLIKPNVGDLPQALASRLVDSNTKIAQTAINICEQLATTMGPPCKQYIRVLFPGLLQGLGDSKAWIRSASITAMNAFGDQCGYKEFFDGEMVFDALKTGSPTLRNELWTWIADKVPKIKAVAKQELVICVPILFNNLEDRNADVRKNAQEAVLGFMIHLGYDGMVKHTEKLKPGSKSVVLGILEKVRPNLPMKPLPSKKKQPSSEKEDKAVRGTIPVANSKNAVKTKAQPAKPSSRKKEEDVDTSPLLTVNNLKQQRSIDETKLKVLKWNFANPREEFVELLKEQMTVANVNKSLIQNMFHSDFRYHIKAIEALTEDLPKNQDALAHNLDLILKWFTLRFFDTNPSVLLKGLEYLHSVFNTLIEMQYRMPETESAAFIPYLIMKIGDPKDAVRNGVRSLFKQLWSIYSVSKIFSYLMDGMKSKNARQRAECLEVMGLIIEIFGLNVCLPNPNTCLKEIAKQISDRDNGVRNAALNCLVQSYYIVGEKIYKMIGNISDKDMSLLEERIKRSSKRSPMAPKIESVTVPIVAGQPINLPEQQTTNSDRINLSDRSPTTNRTINEEDSDNDDLPEVTLPPQVTKEHEPEVEGPFRLDPTLLRELDNILPKDRPAKLQAFDLDFLKDEIVIPTAQDCRAKLIPLSPPKPILPNQSFLRPQSATRLSSPKAGSDLMLVKTIDEITLNNYEVPLRACVQMTEILQSNRGNAIVEYENQLMNAVVNQLKILDTKDTRQDINVGKLYRAILMLIDAFYTKAQLGRKLNSDVLKNLMKELILLLAAGKLENCTNGDAYVKVTNLHCVRVIEKSDPTNIIRALTRLLHECVGNNSAPKLTDLVMKTLWRLIKIMAPWVNEIDYDVVLLEMHNFMKTYPSSWWKDKTDTPLRTVKTVLHTLTKMKGDAIMEHVCKIPNPKESEVEMYILRVLKTIKIDEVKQVPLKSDSRMSLTRSTHALLTDIFQKIGNKEETEEGLNLLYDFLQEHPEADIEPFLKRSSSFFQDYIKNNLQEIAATRKVAQIKAESESQIAASSTTTTISVQDSSEVADKDAKYYLERLKMWKQLWNEQMNEITEEANRTYY